MVQLWMYLGFSTIKLPKVCKMHKGERRDFSWRTELAKNYNFLNITIYIVSLKRFLSTANGESVIAKHTSDLPGNSLWTLHTLDITCILPFQIILIKIHLHYYLITTKHKSKKIIPFIVLRFLERP